jgi:hypothetical protein
MDLRSIALQNGMIRLLFEKHDAMTAVIHNVHTEYVAQFQECKEKLQSALETTMGALSEVHRRLEAVEAELKSTGGKRRRGCRGGRGKKA